MASTMKRTTILTAFSLILLMALPGAAQEWGGELPCEGALDASAELPGLLSQVKKYQSTYVLVYREEATDSLELESPALREMRLGVYAGSPAAEIAAGAGLAGFENVSFDLASAAEIVADVLAGELDAGLVWAPLAGLAVLELDFDYKLSLRTATGPHPPPPALAAAAAAAPPSECAQEIEKQLGGYGVVPADKLVKLDIRRFLNLRPPPRDSAAARQGSELYATNCAKCHGPDAVAAPGALAPVDLLVSTPRFSYPGFLYIVLNGRPQNGMPRFQGTLSREEVELIYQYARERSHGASN